MWKGHFARTKKKQINSLGLTNGAHEMAHWRRINLLEEKTPKDNKDDY